MRMQQLNPCVTIVRFRYIFRLFIALHLQKDYFSAGAKWSNESRPQL